MSVHPTAIVDPAATIGKNVEIGPFCQVGPKVTLEDGVKLLGHSVITGCTTIGRNSTIHPFAVLGGDPQHLGYKGEDTKLILGENNIVREHATMHTGTTSGRGQTVIGKNCMFMAATHIAHDCIVGDNVIMANNATLGGHVVVSDFVFLGGLAAVHQYCRIGVYSFVGASAFVAADVIPYGSVIGNHARLEGLNIVGMKRRNTPRKIIHDIRAAYRLLFAREGTLQERIEDVTEMYAHSEEVMTIINFMREDSSRALCTPRN